MAQAKHTPGRKTAPTLKARVAGNLVAQRKALGWTQEQLATKTGINPETVSRYERGASLPSIEALERLAIALGTDLAVLVATPSPKRPEDAQLVGVWLSGLADGDREFVKAQIESTVRHLKGRTTSTTSQD